MTQNLKSAEGIDPSDITCQPAADAYKPRVKLAKVWLVGGKKDSPFVDVYNNEQAAIAAVKTYLKDPHWRSKIPQQRRGAFDVLMTHGTFEDALRYYNDHVDAESKWYMTEQEVRG